MIARQLCGLVAQCRACLEADRSFALVRQRDPALNDTKRKKGTGLPVKGRQVSPTARAVPYKGWHRGTTIADLPSTSGEARGVKEEQEVRE